MIQNVKKLWIGVPAVLLLTGCDETIRNAGYNTLLGMGMAFAVLIIISLVISLLSLLNKAQGGKKDDEKDMRLKAIDNTIHQIEQQENVQAAQAAPAAVPAPAAAAPDAGELIAVIGAAVAAYEADNAAAYGYAQPAAVRTEQPLPDLTNWEGVYVRPIRKTGVVNWKRA